MRIVLCYPVEPRHVARIQAAAPAAEVVDAGQERVAQELLAADLFCGHAKVPVPWDDVVARGRLRWIQSSAAGLDHCLVPSVVASPIVVTSASGVLADQVAEQTLALLLALLRSLPAFWRAQARREFIRRPTHDLHGARVGLVGLGGNGLRLVEVLRPFRVEIAATDWFPIDRPPGVAALWPAEELPRLLTRSEILILAAPLTEQTRGLIDARALAQMPRGSWLINVARGPLVVEPDLEAALRGGQLAGAGVDVTVEEPLAADSPLWDAPNLIITPHVGGQSRRRIDDMTDLFCENLRRYRQGLPLVNLVENRLGFPSPAVRAEALGVRRPGEDQA